MKRMNHNIMEKPGPSGESDFFPAMVNGQRTKLRRLHRNSSSSSESEADLKIDLYEERKKLYRKFRKQDNGIIWKFKNLQMLAERDNYKNHLREAMMTASNPGVVEDAGVLMAIEEIGLHQRLTPLMQFYALDHPDLCPSGMSSIDSDLTDSSFSSHGSDSCEKQVQSPFHVPQSTDGNGQETSDTNFNFEDFAVNAAINNKGLSL